MRPLERGHLIASALGCLMLCSILEGCGGDRFGVNVTVELAGAGTVTLDPPGGSYQPGTIVTLQAAANEGYGFFEWRGDVTGSANPVQLTVDANKQVTAHFVASSGPGPYSLTTTVLPDGQGSVELDPPGGSYPRGTVVTLTAVPGSDYVFREWYREHMDYPIGWTDTSGTQGTVNPIQITMDMDRNAIAVFIPDDRFFVDVSVSPSDGGSVVLDPAPSGGTYAWGTLVTLRPEEAGGFVFSGWGGDVSGVQQLATTETFADRSITAHFTRVVTGQHTLTVLLDRQNRNDALIATVTAAPPGCAYDPGTVVTLTAELNGYWGWWEGVDGALDDFPATVTTDADKTVILHLAWNYPVCQAHKLLDEDSVVRVTAEELLLMMGERELGYMDWAAREAGPELAERIREVMTSIREGARPDPSRWPGATECVERLDHSDRVVAIMAAQMLRAIRVRNREKFAPDVEARAAALLDEARSRSLAGAWRR